jgi:hypothetical protein
MARKLGLKLIDSRNVEPMQVRGKISVLLNRREHFASICKVLFEYIRLTSYSFGSQKRVVIWFDVKRNRFTQGALPLAVRGAGFHAREESDGMGQSASIIFNLFLMGGDCFHSEIRERNE